MNDDKRFKNIEESISELCSDNTAMYKMLSESNQRINELEGNPIVLTDPYNKKPGRFKPKEYCRYFTVVTAGAGVTVRQVSWHGDEADLFRYSQGNVFKLDELEKADKHLEYLLALGRVREYCEENWWFEPNHYDSNEMKYNILYDYQDKKLCHTQFSFMAEISLLPTLPSTEACKDVEKNCQDDLLIILKIPSDEN